MESQIGPYQVTAELGRGGMGVVYKARDTALERFVAIKVLADKVAGDAELIARFQREARSAASLNHPNVIQIYNIGEYEGQPYFVMEFVEGESLSQLIRKHGRLEPQLAARILVQAASGLAAAHEKEIIHRDIKPGNLMIDRRGNVKIADFGIAYMAEMGKKLTGTGQFLGTPGYLSPELCQGLTLDGRADIFSLGVVFFEMLTGSQPFQADSPFAMIHKVVQSPLPNVRELNPAVDDETVAILQRMVAKNPAERYDDCHALIADLEQCFGVQTYRTLGDRPASGAAAAVSPDLSATLTDADMKPTEFAPVPAPTATSLNTVPPPPPAFPEQNPEPANASRPAPPPAVPEQNPEPANARRPAPPPATAAKPQRAGALALVAIAALLVIGAVAVAFQLGRSGGEPPPETAAGSSVTETLDSTTPLPPAESAMQAGGDAVGTQNHTQNETGPNDVKQNNIAHEQPGNLVDVDQATPTAAEPDAVASAAKHQVVAEPAGSQQPAATDSAQKDREPETTPVETTTFQAADTPTDAADSPQIKRPKQRLSSQDNSPRPRTAGNRQRREKPKVPNVVVAVLGDPVLAEPLRGRIEEYLAGDDYPVLALADMADPSHLIRQEPIPFVRLRQALKRHDTDVLILIRLDHRGERELRFMGRAETAWQAQVQLDVLSLYRPLPLGSRAGEQLLEYTTLNANQKAKIAALKIYQQVETFMSAY